MAQGNQDIEKQLRGLQCPFTWEMSECPEYDLDKVHRHLYHDEKYVPQTPFIRHLLVTYALVLKQKYELADERIEKAEKLIPEFAELKKEVAQHLLDATKAHCLMRKEKTNEVEAILKNINSIDDEKYLSTINEFKAGLWTHCNDFIQTAKIAIKFAQLSLEYDPNNAVSHFYLGKNIRTLRRIVSCHDLPEEEEIFHFSKAYELDKNPQFGLFLGQAFKEKRMMNKADIILQEIYEMDIQCPSINLRLSLYFLQNGFLHEAQKCLAYVESLTPNDSMFLHYKGLYLMRRQKYQEAAECFKQTYDYNNYGADLGYAKCMRKMGKRFDFVEYFLKLAEKYKNNIEKCKEAEILLHVAFSYYNIKRDIREAIKYFLRAFEMETPELNMTEYRDPIKKDYKQEKTNVYEFLSNEVFPKIRDYKQKKTINLPEDVLEANEKLQQICVEYSKRIENSC